MVNEFLLSLLLLLPALQSRLSNPTMESGLSQASSSPDKLAISPDSYPAVPVTDEERESATIIALALDVHLHSAQSSMDANATIRLRNVSAKPLTRVPLQLSSSLRYDSISILGPHGLAPASFTQAPVTTDTDHTGYAQEAVLTLAEPIAQNATLTIMVLYAGTIKQSAARLELLGAPALRSSASEWDAIQPQGTALRGFGNVLWYPVIAQTALLAEGNRLLLVVADQQKRQAQTQVQLRVSEEFQGQAAPTAIFGDEEKEMIVVDRMKSSVDGESTGLAQVEFHAAPIGFKTPALFVAPRPAAVSSDEPLSIFSSDPAHATRVFAVATSARILLTDWLGTPLHGSLIVLDHAGQPFQQGRLLVTPLEPIPAEQLTPALIYGLTHVWFRSNQPWIQEGLSQFMVLLWTERTEGRDAAVAQLQRDSDILALGEADLSLKTPNLDQALIRASLPVFTHTKAAAVLWQLRDIVGDGPLSQALQQYGPADDSDPSGFQRVLERIAKRDLSWFFDDWVDHDRSLPDLNIVSVNPRVLPSQPGHPRGYLVAVDVHNDGAAVAEVPVAIRSGTLTASARLRVPGHGSASTRVVFEGVPEHVEVNDGTVPELGTTIHTRELRLSALR